MTIMYKAISPLQEFLAYEALWDRPTATFRSLAQELHISPASTLIDAATIAEYKKQLFSVIDELPHFGVRVYGDGEFPERLQDARYPLKVLYYQGDWGLTYLPSVAVVGTRNPTALGIERTKSLVKKLVQDEIVIVSGLAKGIDTAAHQTAIEFGGYTIGVIGTPLNHYYPTENKALQLEIAKRFLLISQVPFSRYAHQTYRQNRLFFPERNVTMSALTLATIIVEAGETSGTLIQARAALEQGRKLFILENNFQNPNLTWPKRLEQKGAIRIKDYDEIRSHLSLESKHSDRENVTSNLLSLNSGEK